MTLAREEGNKEMLAGNAGHLFTTLQEPADAT